MNFVSIEYRTVPIESIIVHRAARQRRELPALDQLAESISRIGVINPPVVNQDLELIAGERRFTVCRDILHHTHITVAVRETEATHEERFIELAENVEREELDWKDKCFAVEEYHNLRISAEEEWTVGMTAEALGIDLSTAARHINLAAELNAGTKLICEADKYSVARNILERLRERRAQADQDRLEAMINGEPAPEVEEELDVSDLLSEPDTPTPTPIIPNEPETSPNPFRCTDFHVFVDNYKGEKFNFIHCDFPYGVNANKHKQGASDKFGGYADSADVYFALLSSLSRAMKNVVSPSAHLMFWYSMDHHNTTVQALTDMGWKVNPFPLIWFRNDNSGIMPDPKRGPRRNYETALIASRNDRKIIQGVSNVSAHPNTKHIHMSEKPIPVLKHFFRMFVDETTRMLDPTMGSGNAVVLAEHLGAFARGLERDKEFYNNARNAYMRGDYDLEDF
jgi:ParB-like chromosome segregation protein Spo0J